MSKDQKRDGITIAADWLKVGGAVFAICSGLYGAVQAYALLPITQKQQQAELDIIKRELRADHEALIRIEDRVEFIKSVLEKNHLAAKRVAMTQD